MQRKIIGLLAIGLLQAVPMAADATISVSTDTTENLLGSFAIDGFYEEITVANFGALLPGSIPRLFGQRVSEPLESYRFGTAVEGSPDSPFFLYAGSTDAALSFADLGGSFNNNNSSTTVYFLFSNLHDSGGGTGAFSGSFCFSIAQGSCTSSVPEPGTLALLGLGFAGLGLIWRRRAN